MPKWKINYVVGEAAYVEADSVSVAGTIVAFMRHTNIEIPDGKIAAIPISFIDLSNRNVVLVEKVEEKDAEVLSIV